MKHVPRFSKAKLGILILIAALIFVIPVAYSAEQFNPDSGIGGISGFFNDFFTTEGYQKYSKIVDFFVFFIIFTTVILIGLRTAFKDSEMGKQVGVLAVALGLTSTIALMFGGTFLGKPITVASLFPYALGLLAFIIIFLPIFFLLHLLMGKKHPIIAFIIALIITLIIYFLLAGTFGSLNFFGKGAGKEAGKGKDGIKITTPDIKPVAGCFVVGKENVFAKCDGTSLSDEEQTAKMDEVLNIGNECKVSIETGASSEWEGAGTPEEARNLNEDLAKRRCLYLMSLASVNELDSNCEKDGKKAYTVSDSNSPSARFFEITCIGSAKEASASEGGKDAEGKDVIGKSSSCKELSEYDLLQLVNDIKDGSVKAVTGKGKTELEKLKEFYDKCMKEKNKYPPESRQYFQDIAMKYQGALAEAWFDVGDYDKAYEAIKKANTDTGGSGNDVSKSGKKEEILRLWYDKLVLREMKKYVRSANSISIPPIVVTGDKTRDRASIEQRRKDTFEKKRKIDELKKLFQKYQTARAEGKLAKYTPPKIDLSFYEEP